MHATRGPVLPLLLGISLTVIGCGNGNACVLDSDCADIAQVCVAQQCTPAGGLPDAAMASDGGPARDAGRRDAGGVDSGPEVMDAGTDAGAPVCVDVSGPWQILTIASGDGTCGAAMVGYQTTLAAAADSCSYSATSAGGGTVALDGTFTIDAGGVIEATTSTLIAGGDAALPCTGTVTAASISLTCVGCMMELVPVPPP